MAYEKQGFSSGMLLKADHLNHMEEGIANPVDNIPDGQVGKEAEVYFVSPQEITMLSDSGMMMNMLNVEHNFILGDTYTISYNGVDYKCIYENGAIGNMGALSETSPNTGEPFLIIVEGGSPVLVALDNSTVVQFSAKGIAPLPINSEYAPTPVILDLITNNFPSITSEVVSGDIQNEALDNALKEALRTGLIKVKCKISADITNIGGGYITFTDEECEFNCNIHCYNDHYYISTVFNYHSLLIEKPIGNSGYRAVIKKFTFA